MCGVPCIDRVEKNVQRFYYISTIFLKNTTIRRRIEKIKNRSKSMDGALPRYFFLCKSTLLRKLSEFVKIIGQA